MLPEVGSRPGGTARRRSSLLDEQVEERLDRLLRVRGEDDLNQLRDHARPLAGELDADAEFQKLDAIIGALLRTRDAALGSRTGQARAAGHPYDPDRLLLFQELHRVLLAEPFPDHEERHPPGTAGFSNAAFFDAYFSNWIEGTQFELDEAREIVTRGAVPASRPADGHDILGTFSLVGDPAFMTGALARILEGPDGFVDVLHEAHRRIMSARPEQARGRFKTQPNRAGTTLFVAPDLVRGTLREAYGLLGTLPDGLARAAYLMFAITEVHPYADGNGRAARALTNAALVASERSRVIIVSGYTDDYLRALKALSHQRNARPFVQMLHRAQQFVAELPFEDYGRTVELLRETGALDDSGDRPLRLPSELA